MPISVLHVVKILSPLDIWQCWWPVVGPAWWPPSSWPCCLAWWWWAAPSPPMTPSSHYYRNTQPTPHTSLAGGLTCGWLMFSTTISYLLLLCCNLWLVVRGMEGCRTSAGVGMTRLSTPPWTTYARTATTSTRSPTSTPCAGMLRPRVKDGDAPQVLTLSVVCCIIVGRTASAAPVSSIVSRRCCWNRTGSSTWLRSSARGDGGWWPDLIIVVHLFPELTVDVFQ